MTYIPILPDPTEFNGKDIEQCNNCQTDLNTTEEQEEKMCFECIEEIEEKKELEKKFLKFPELEEDEKLKINLKAQRETLNKIFDSFSIATIGSFDKDGNLI